MLKRWKMKRKSKRETTPVPADLHLAIAGLIGDQFMNDGPAKREMDRLLEPYGFGFEQLRVDLGSYRTKSYK